MLVAVAAVTSGCIGAIDRADFDDEVRARGGGISSQWIDDSVEAAADRLGVVTTDEIELLTLTIDGTNRVVTVSARRGDRPDFVDSVVVSEGEVVAVTPIQDADQLPLDDLTIRLGDLPIDQLERLTDEAVDAFGADDGFVTGIRVALENGEPTLAIDLESSRRTGTAVFAADGTLIELTP